MMTFLVILIALLFQWYSGWGAILHRHDLLRSYWHGLSRLLGKSPMLSGYGNLAFAVLPLVIAVGIISYLLLGLVNGILLFLFGLFIMLYCVKAYNYRKELAGLLKACDEHDWHQAAAEVSRYTNEAVEAQPEAVARTVLETFVRRAETRVFGVIFWFFILGPMGAVLYYLTHEIYLYAPIDCKEHGPRQALLKAAGQFKAVLDWIPQRLAALAFVLAGNYTASFKKLTQMLPAGLENSSEYYTQVAFDAMLFDDYTAQEAYAESIREGINLMERSAVLWLVVMGLIAVF